MRVHVGCWRKRTPRHSQTMFLGAWHNVVCPPRRRRTTAGSRLLIAVHLPSGTAQACVRLGLASGGARSALCDSDAEYRLRQCHGDRWTVSPREIAASMSASSVHDSAPRFRAPMRRCALGARNSAPDRLPCAQPGPWRHPQASPGRAWRTSPTAGTRPNDLKLLTGADAAHGGRA